VICAFIDSFKAVFGVVPACRALSAHGIAISPRGYYARLSRPPSRRAVRDAWLTGLLRDIFEPGPGGRRKPESLYGAVKIWGHLRRQGIGVARCTVERLMRAGGWRGNARGRRKVRTTVPDPAHPRHPDLVNRDFRAAAPGQLLVADFTYSAQLAVMYSPAGGARFAWWFPVVWLHIIRGLPGMPGAGRWAGTALALGLGRSAGVVPLPWSRGRLRGTDG